VRLPAVPRRDGEEALVRALHLPEGPERSLRAGQLGLAEAEAEEGGIPHLPRGRGGVRPQEDRPLPAERQEPGRVVEAAGFELPLLAAEPAATDEGQRPRHAGPVQGGPRECYWPGACAPTCPLCSPPEEEVCT